MDRSTLFEKTHRQMLCERFRRGRCICFVCHASSHTVPTSSHARKVPHNSGRCGLEKVDTQHHKHFSSSPSGGWPSAGDNPCMLFVWLCCHRSWRGSLQPKKKKIPTRQEMIKKSPLASDASAEKDLGSLRGSYRPQMQRNSTFPASETSGAGN